MRTVWKLPVCGFSANPAVFASKNTVVPGLRGYEPCEDQGSDTALEATPRGLFFLRVGVPPSLGWVQWS